MDRKIAGFVGASKGDAPLIDIHHVDSMFPVAIAVSFFIWIFLLLFVYSLVPSEDYIYLEGAEREAAASAAFAFFVSTGLSSVPLIMRRGFEKRQVSGILYAAIGVQFIAMCTNALLAWAPTVVVVDPVTHSRVYLVRWCEWIPLSGLMTFFSEVVDSSQGVYGILVPVLISMAQSLSCLMAIILPFCPSVTSWCLTMTMSFLLYLVMFPRLWYKHQGYKAHKHGLSLTEMEKSCRLRFAYHLLIACSCAWTVLVTLYFVNMAAFVFFPDTNLVKNQALPMILDTFFDLLAKAVYMKIIVDVHETVFDTEGRARRQLSELKKMISVLWESSSDVILISVKQGDGFTTMISPTFPAMIGTAMALEIQGKDSTETGTAVVVKSEKLHCFENESDKGEPPLRLKSSAYFVHAKDLPYFSEAGCHIPSPTMDGALSDAAGSIVAAAWTKMEAEEDATKGKEEALVVLDLHGMDGSVIKSEIKVSRHGSDAVIAVVRDVTERYLRFEAERRVHSEALARQKDAHAVNRFTRHEIKNGLLSGIHLCQEVSKRISILKAQANLSPMKDNDTSQCLTELDSTLHEVLETVLAEAMAREVVHESYAPRLERVDVYSALASTSGLRDDDKVRDRFPIHVCPSNMPCLMMDPQLLKYIHRNAVSNACKYGLKGGKVITEAHYFEKKGEFELDVINEPGPHNDELVKMGDQACQAVFKQGKRLSVHDCSNDGEKQISSGDGAWIMQKCAKTLGGSCTIRFDPHQTIFSFRCKVEPCCLPSWTVDEDFQVPSNTFGVAFDDSHIQRKLMARILKHAGVEESRTIIRGSTPNDIEELDTLLVNLLESDPTCKVLVLMDENLDYDVDGVSKRLSGSSHSEKALNKLSPDMLARTILLMRSANDSDSDVAMYKKRTHGFFPKASMQKRQIIELLAPAWKERFASCGVPETITTTTTTEVRPDPESTSITADTTDCSSGDEDTSCRKQFSDGLVSGEELIASLRNVDKLITDVESDWDTVWGKLHSFMGDMMAVEENDKIELCVDLISELRGRRRPSNLLGKWSRIRNLVLEEVNG